METNPGVDFSAEVKAKVPLEIRQAIEVIARERLLTVSDIVREAVVAYLAEQRSKQEEHVNAS